MVCPRCIMAVEQTLTKLHIPFVEVKLGEAILKTENPDYHQLDEALKEIGFELIRDKNKIILEQVKTTIIEYIHHNEGDGLKINFSDYLSQTIGKDYSSLSNLFSEKEGITIEKYIILQKIERVKELISYQQLNFSEIAFKLNYSNSSHLSAQFKKVTGMTLSEYRKGKSGNRDFIDKI